MEQKHRTICRAEVVVYRIEQTWNEEHQCWDEEPTEVEFEEDFAEIPTNAPGTVVETFEKIYQSLHTVGELLAQANAVRNANDTEIKEVK